MDSVSPPIGCSPCNRQSGAVFFPSLEGRGIIVTACKAFSDISFREIAMLITADKKLHHLEPLTVIW